MFHLLHVTDHADHSHLSPFPPETPDTQAMQIMPVQAPTERGCDGCPCLLPPPRQAREVHFFVNQRLIYMG